MKNSTKIEHSVWIAVDRKFKLVSSQIVSGVCYRNSQDVQLLLAETFPDHGPSFEKESTLGAYTYVSVMTGHVFKVEPYEH